MLGLHHFPEVENNLPKRAGLKGGLLRHLCVCSE